jgi:hypothetical protein
MKSTIIVLTAALICGQSLVAQVPVKGGYEDWCIVVPIPFDQPECWISASPLCQARSLPDDVALTEDAKWGTYALLLETGVDDHLLPFPAVAYYQNALTARPEKLTGFYKADLKGDDYSSIRVTLKSDRGIVGWGVLDITKSTNIYTAFEMPLEYISPNVKPDSIFLSISSSYDQATTGTILMLDEVSLISITDVTEPLAEPYISRITPNPATDEIRIDVPGNHGLLYFILYDNSGRIIRNQEFENEVRMNVSELTAGLYFYEIRLSNRDIYDTGRLRIAEHGL